MGPTKLNLYFHQFLPIAEMPLPTKVFAMDYILKEMILPEYKLLLILRVLNLGDAV